MTKSDIKAKAVHQVKLWGTPFTLTYRFYNQGSKIGDVHAKGVTVYLNINLQEFLERQYALRTLARQDEHKKTLRRLRKEGNGVSDLYRMAWRRGCPVGTLYGYVVPDETPVRYVEENGCLRPRTQ